MQGGAGKYARRVTGRGEKNHTKSSKSGEAELSQGARKKNYRRKPMSYGQPRGGGLQEICVQTSWVRIAASGVEKI